MSVYIISCPHCSSFLSNRGQKITLVSNNSISGYSSDIGSAQIQEQEQKRVFEHCSCLISRLICKSCKQICGYHVVNACESCLTRPNNGMYWIFLNAKGEETAQQWTNIPKPQIHFHKLLISYGIEDSLLQILQSEKITSLNELQMLTNQQLKNAGLKLGQIARLRKLCK